jgi:hypothetical protein
VQSLSGLNGGQVGAGGPSGQSGAPLQIQSIPIRQQRPVPTFFAVTNCHHGDHHKKDSSKCNHFPVNFYPSVPLLLSLHTPPPLDLGSPVPRGGGVCVCMHSCVCVCVCVCVYVCVKCPD